MSSLTLGLTVLVLLHIGRNVAVRTQNDPAMCKSIQDDFDMCNKENQQCKIQLERLKGQNEYEQKANKQCQSMLEAAEKKSDKWWTIISDGYKFSGVSIAPENFQFIMYVLLGLIGVGLLSFLFLVILHKQSYEKIAAQQTAALNNPLPPVSARQVEAITRRESQGSGKPVRVIYREKDGEFVNNKIIGFLETNDLDFDLYNLDEDDSPDTVCDIDLYVNHRADEPDKPGAIFFVYDNIKKKGRFEDNLHKILKKKGFLPQ